MALDFLNDARSYDASKRCVNFWGHDSTFEVTFRLDHAALSKFAGEDKLSEQDALRVFDDNLEHIRRAAKKLYRGPTKRYWELSTRDM